jgi:acyl-CoA synthetase (AMP-forming)/AMP-acid ligase II
MKETESMLDEQITTSQTGSNVGWLLTAMARRMPDAVCVVEPLRRVVKGKRRYRHLTFRELDEDSSRIAAGLRALGVPRGARLVLLVRPSIDFISLVFALFKAEVVTVLIDPGMGRRNLVACLQDSDPEGFVAIPLVHALRILVRRRFPRSRFHITVGRKWFWGGVTLDELRQMSNEPLPPTDTNEGDPAAIIFTTGSTGPPKGVLYQHGNFLRQVSEIRDHYNIQAGEIDLPGFPLFALFNAAMGVTTIIPEMDFTRPAQADPRNILEAANDWHITQAFGSPALWNVVGRYCEQTGHQMPTLRRVLSAGAPVPPHVLERMKRAIHPAGEIYTPYGATESLPVASISATEVLTETAAFSREGAGTCVGHRFPGIEWKVIRISDGPIAQISEVEELPRGEIGELLVTGPVVTREYVTRREANALHKVHDGDRIWHRMGDVGYLDERDRFWFCGRKSQRVITAETTLYTIQCEAIFNQHPRVYRSALVGVGPARRQRPVVYVETWPDQKPQSAESGQQLVNELLLLAAKYEHTQMIRDVFRYDSLPVDIRHNAKIFREQLAQLATQMLATEQ